MSKIETGDAIVLVLHSPREKFWGVLHEINAAGANVRGIDLNAFDDFVRSMQSGEGFYGLSTVFFPLWRMERISKDERSGEIPSMFEQFEQRTGLNIADF